MATIQGVYVALFGRPADPAGLEFFNEATQNGADLTAIGDLAATAEYQTRFEGQNSVQIVTAIYQSLFNRAPEAAGLEFFVAALQAGTLNINNIAIAILDGAQGDDLTILNNKLAAANAFTTALDTAVEVESYKGDDAAEFGRDFLSEVSTTVPTAEEVAAAVTELGGIAGNDGIFDLSTGTDTATVNGSLSNGINSDFKFTANNQVVNGEVGVTLQAGDTLADGSTTDNDVLNIKASEAGLNLVLGAINNIETFNITGGTTDDDDLDNSTLDLSNVTGLKTVTMTGRVANGQTVDFIDFDASGVTTFDISAVTGQNVASRVNINEDQANQAITIVGGSIATTVLLGDGNNTITTGAGNDIIEVGAGNNTIVAGNGTNTITVSLSADADYEGDNDGTNTITGGTGKDTVTIDADGANTIGVGNGINEVIINGKGDNTVTGGDNADTVTINDAGDGDNTVSTGAGDDTIEVAGDGDNTITAGAGVDSIDLTGSDGENALVFADGDLGVDANGDADSSVVDTVTGFATADDTITFGLAAAVNAVNYTEITVGAAVDTIAEVLTEINGDEFDGANQYVFVANGTNGWLFVDSDLDGTADYGLSLVGLDAVTDFSADNII